MSGVIPEGWINTNLESVGNIVTGKTPSKKKAEYFNGSIPFIKPGDVNDQGKIEFTDELITELGAETVPTIPSGSIVVTCIGNLGRCAITSKRSSTNQQINSVIPSKEINAYFLYYQLRTLKNWMLKESSATTVTIINKTRFSQAPIILPPLAEQKVIADKLDELLAQLESTKARLDAIPAILKSFRQSLLAAAVSGKLTEEWHEENFSQLASLEIESLNIEREKILGTIKKVDKQLKRQPNDVELPPLPSSWCYNHLDPFLSLERAGMKTGPFGSLLKKSEHKITGIPVLGIENISDGTFSPETKIKITEEKASELAGYDIQPGDLIISRSGTVGDICVIPDGIKIARFSTNIMRLSFMKGAMLPSFFTLLFLGSPVVLKQVADLCKGSTRLFLNQKILSSIKYPVPPKKEQTEIVRRVEELFAFADIVEAQVNAAQARVNNLTQSILAKAFRGELTKDWRTANPDLISGENSAEALLERIKAEREKLSTKSKPSKPRKKVIANEG